MTLNLGDLELSDEERVRFDELSTIVNRLSLRHFPVLATMIKLYVLAKASDTRSPHPEIEAVRRTDLFNWVDEITHELIDILHWLPTRSRL